MLALLVGLSFTQDQSFYDASTLSSNNKEDKDREEEEKEEELEKEVLLVIGEARAYLLDQTRVSQLVYEVLVINMQKEY